MKKLIIILILTVVVNVYGQVSVVANKSVSEASLSSAKVVSIYSLETTKWSNGNKIIVFDNSGDAKNNFYSAIGKDPLSIKKEWMRKQLTGEAKAPEKVESDEDVILKVAATAGSIGFVKSSSVSGNVKVLLELK